MLYVLYFWLFACFCAVTLLNYYVLEMSDISGLKTTDCIGSFVTIYDKLSVYIGRFDS